MMKTFSYLTLICLGVTLMWSCSGSGDSGSTADTSSVGEKVEAMVDSAKADTIAMLMGSLIGNDRAIDFILSDDSDVKAIDRKDYIRGLRVALNSNNRSASYTQGVRAANDILRKMKDFGNYDVELDRERVLAAIERCLRADSISEAEVAAANSAYNVLLQRIYTTDVQ